MKTILNAIKSLPRKGQHNLAKILCLAVGLAVSSVIITEVYFEQSYDTWFPNSERTYQVIEEITRDGEFKEWQGTPGAIAKGLEKYCPQVEAATRTTSIFVNIYLNTQYDERLRETIYVADSSLFDVFPRKAVLGNLSQTLNRPFYCAVSKSFAERVGMDRVIGLRLTPKDSPNLHFIVNAVYEDFPRGSSLYGQDICLAMNTVTKMAESVKDGFDGTQNWLGNDRFFSAVRLKKGTDPKALEPAIRKMMADNIDMDALAKSGQKLMFGMKVLSKQYTDDPYIQKMCWIMSLLAFVLLFSTVMNYLLIMVGNVLQRSREMAVRKCFGAGRKTMMKITFSETAVVLVIAILLAAVLLFLCKGAIDDFLSAPLDILIFSHAAWILGAICVGVLLLGGLVPAYLYNRTPVTAAFRGYHSSRRRWKLALLAVQFFASSLLVSFLVVIQLQYNMMLNVDTGYDYKNLAVVTVAGAQADANFEKIPGEIKKLSEVEQVSGCTMLPVETQNGNNIQIEGDDREFNVADLYFVGEGFVKMMKLKVLEGEGFNEKADSVHQVMISKSCKAHLDSMYHWNGNVVGKRIWISEHSDAGNVYFNICGVYDDFKMGSLAFPETRPSILFYRKARNPYTLVKLHQQDEASINAVRRCVENTCPGYDVTVRTYSSMVEDAYRSTNSLRNGLLVAGISTFIIALVGLVGYTIDEVNRRRKEIAIRKVNGARIQDILVIFIKGILWVAVPSLIVGTVGAYAVSAQWLMLFEEKITLSPVIFLGSILVLLAIIILMVAWNSYKVANSNPVKFLKDE